MGTGNMKKRRAKDKDILDAGNALLRAARNARRIAYMTDTPLVIWKDGKVVNKKITRQNLPFSP